MQSLAPASQRNPARVDQALALTLTLALELEIWLTGNASEHRIAVSILGPLATVAVAVRRRYPTHSGLLAALSATVLQTWWPTALLSYAIAWMCDMYALTVWTTRRWFAIGLVVFAGGALTGLPWAADRAGGFFFIVVATSVMLLVRAVVGDRDRRLRLAEREREIAAREAVVEERARIARELHDAIAHNVSMMVVQAGAERRVLPAEANSTHDVLETIEHIGRGALTEMRRLVGMLRSDTVDPLEPQPGLADLSKLVAQVRAAGLAVDLHIEGERRELPVGIELSAYRIVQEALTNTLKHARDARAAVSIRYGRDSLELEIADDGGRTHNPIPNGGHGLVGMRERVALYGGTLEAGRRATGGFSVHVLLPIA
jgi:signal transduction histidine kinase